MSFEQVSESSPQKSYRQGAELSHYENQTAGSLHKRWSLHDR